MAPVCLRLASAGHPPSRSRCRHRSVLNRATVAALQRALVPGRAGGLDRQLLGTAVVGTGLGREHVQPRALPEVGAVGVSLRMLRRRAILNGCRILVRPRTGSRAGVGRSVDTLSASVKPPPYALFTKETRAFIYGMQPRAVQVRHHHPPWPVGGVWGPMADAKTVPTIGSSVFASFAATGHARL